MSTCAICIYHSVGLTKTYNPCYCNNFYAKAENGNWHEKKCYEYQTLENERINTENCPYFKKYNFDHKREVYNW